MAVLGLPDWVGSYWAPFLPVFSHALPGGPGCVSRAPSPPQGIANVSTAGEERGCALECLAFRAGPGQSSIPFGWSGTLSLHNLAAVIGAMVPSRPEDCLLLDAGLPWRWAWELLLTRHPQERTCSPGATSCIGSQLSSRASARLWG